MSLRCTLGTIFLSPWVPLMFMVVMGTIWAVRIPVNLKRNILILTDMKREKHIKCDLFGRKLAAHYIIIANSVQVYVFEYTFLGLFLKITVSFFFFVWSLYLCYKHFDFIGLKGRKDILWEIFLPLKNMKGAQ